MSTQILRKGPPANRLFGASTKIGTPISFAIRIPTDEFMLLIGIFEDPNPKIGVLEGSII